MSSLIDEYRQKYPNDYRSDSELTLWLGSSELKNDLFAAYPDFQEEFQTITARLDEIAAPTAGDYVKQAAGSVVRGFAGGVAALPEATAILGGKIERMVRPEVEPDLHLLEGMAEGIREAGEKIAPDRVPALEKSFWLSKVPSGIGSSLSFLAGGVASVPLKIPRLLGMATMGAAAGGAQGYEEAKAKGADEDKAFQSFLLNAGVGTSEIFPLANMLNRLDKFSGGTFKRALVTAGKESFEEALQETLQSGAGDVIAKNLVAYDPDRVLFQDAASNAGAGGVVGFTLSLLTSALGKKLGTRNLERGTRNAELGTEEGEAAAEKAVEIYTGKIKPEDRAEFAELGAKEEAGQLSQQEKQVVEGFKGERRAAYEFVKSQPTPLGTELEEEIAAAYAGNVERETRSAERTEEEEEETRNAERGTRNPVAGDLEGAQAAVSSLVETAPLPVAEQGEEGVGFQPPITQMNADEESGSGSSAPIREIRGQPPSAFSLQPSALPPSAEVAALDSLLEKESPDDLLGQLAFETGAVVTGEGGRGKQAAPAFVETEDDAELAKDHTADASDKTKSRKLAVLLKDNHVLVGTFTINGTGPRAKRVAAVSRDGKLENVALVELKGRGYRLIGALKTKEPTSGYAVTYTPEQWARLAGQADERLRVERGKVRGALPATAFEEGAEARRVVGVEERTPADSMAAEEGFTPDEAGALFDALAGVKPEGVSAVLPGLVRSNEDVRNAVAKMLAALEGTEEQSPQELLHEVIEYVQDAKRIQGKSKEGFAKSLVAAVTRAATEGDGGRRAEAAAEDGEGVGEGTGGRGQEAGGRRQGTGVRGQESGGSSAGTDVGAAGSGGTVAAAAGVGENALAGTRFHQGYVPSGYTATPSEIGARWQGILRGAAMAGENVVVLDGEANSMAGELSRYDNAARAITLVLGDVHEPGAQGLYKLTEEVSHAVFAGLPAKDRQMLQNAVRGVTDEMLGVSIPTPILSPVLPPGEREGVLQEERLVNRTSQRIMGQGFNPDEARGFAQAFWRLLKQLYLRAAMAWGRAWGVGNAERGTGNAERGGGGVGNAERGTRNAELAADYFQNRVESWLAGDRRALSFVDFMGGVARVEHFAEWHTPAYGATALRYRWNAETFEMEVQEMSPDNVRAIQFNAANPTIRYHTPRGVLSPREVSPEAGPEVKAEDIAANNEVEWLLGGQFQRWVANGNNRTTTGQPAMTPEGFQRWVLPPSMDLPAENVAAANAELVRAGKPPLPPALAISDLNPETQRYAGTKAHASEQKIRTFWENRKNEADEALNPNKPGSTQRKYDRTAKRSRDLSKLYLDGEFLFAEMREDVVGWTRFLRDNARRIGTLGHKAGELEQVLRELEGKMDEGVARSSADVIDRLVRRFADSEQTRVSFVEMLENIAATDIPWSELSIAEIKDVIRNSTYPELASSQLDPLRENTAEGRGLLAIAAVFAKRNDLVMAMLGLRHSRTQYQDRAAVENALDIAMSDQREAFKNARRTLDRQNRLHAKAERILVELERVKAEQGRLNEELLEAGRFTDFYADAMPLLREQMARTERLLGGSEVVFEATFGEKYVVAPDPNSAVAAVEANEFVYQHERDGGADRQLKEHIRMNDAWLEAHNGDPEKGPIHPLYGGATYNRLKIQNDKQIENEMQGQQNKGVRDMVQALFGSMAAKLDQTANPSAKAISRRLRQYMTHHDTYRRPGETWSNDFSRAEDKARKALGSKREPLEVFRKRWGDPARAYMEQRPDLQAGAPNIDVGEERAIAAAADFLKVPGPARKAFAEYHKVWSRDSFNAIEASRKMGNKIQDDVSGMFRDVRGARGFESMKVVSGHLHLIFREMMGQPNAPGPWANAELGARNAEQEYAADPAALRARLKPMVTKRVWMDFVKPIADRPATFNAPKDAGGFYQLARVEDVRLAFKRTAVGDLVGFAEELFRITGNAERGTGNMAEFVAETLDTFEKYFKIIKGLHQEQSMASKYTIEPVQQLLMNARQSESLPKEFVEYRVFDLKSTRGLLNTLASHAAFGRNMVGIETDFETALEHFKNEERKLQRLIESTGGVNAAKLKEAARREGVNLETLQDASKHVAMLEHELEKFRAFVNSQGGVAMEFKPWAELMNTAVALTVQGPGTALIDSSSLFKPIQVVGLNRIGLAWTARAIKSVLVYRAGSILEVFGKTIRAEAEHIKRMHEFGQYDTTWQHSVKERIASARLNLPVQPGAGMFQRIGRAMAVGARASRELLRTGIAVRRPAEPRFFRLKPAAWFTQLSEEMNAGATIATWKTFEDMVGRAAQWLNNPARAKELNDVGFSFTKDHAKQLGFRKELGGLIDNEAGFQSMLAMFNEYGLSLERLAKEYIGRGMTGPVLSDKAYGRLLPVAPAELMQEASILSRPSWLLTNPIAHTALPFVGWGIAQTAGVEGSFYPKLSDPDLKSFRKGLVAFSALIGVGLAYSFLRDLYDEDVLKKKSNRLSLTWDNLALAMLDRMDQVGSLGILGGFANSTFNVATAREFTIDSRVFAVSSFTQLSKVVGAWFRQGTATYATVGRPLLQAMGGSGFLQHVQIMNGLLGGIPGFENEARVTARINAGNWLRVAGRELGLDVRISRGAGELPGPMRPWIVEMTMAAYANDPLEFEQAYRKAVAVARELGRPDPEESVQRSFQYQHPLRSVFRSPPSEAQYQQLLRALPEDGRRDVTEAVRLLNSYGERLGLKEYEGKRGARNGERGTAARGLNLRLNLNHGQRSYGVQDFRERSLRLLGQ